LRAADERVTHLTRRNFRLFVSPSMRVLRPIIACCLALFWMPLTVHCGLEAAGLLPLPEWAGDACCDRGNTCDDSVCAVVEDGDYTANTGSLKVLPAPAAADAAILLLHQSLVAPPGEPAAALTDFERPSGWVGTWHFVRRAACPPRAPTLNA
jgi:hypothetical protein